MLMCWAWVTFLAALTFHVCTPLIHWEREGDGKKIAAIYLATGVTFVLLFVWSSVTAFITTTELDGIGKAGRVGSNLRAFDGGGVGEEKGGEGVVRPAAKSRTLP